MNKLKLEDKLTKDEIQYLEVYCMMYGLKDLKEFLNLSIETHRKNMNWTLQMDEIYKKINS